MDITKDGLLSCAFYVSSILVITNLISEVHATVKGTIQDIKSYGWKRIENPSAGDLIVWEENLFSDNKRHKHIGFFIDEETAVSHSDKEKVPTAHHITFNDSRDIEAIYTSNKLRL